MRHGGLAQQGDLPKGPSWVAGGRQAFGQADPDLDVCNRPGTDTGGIKKSRHGAGISQQAAVPTLSLLPRVCGLVAAHVQDTLASGRDLQHLSSASRNAVIGDVDRTVGANRDRSWPVEARKQQRTRTVGSDPRQLPGPGGEEQSASRIFDDIQAAIHPE